MSCGLVDLCLETMQATRDHYQLQPYPPHPSDSTDLSVSLSVSHSFTYEYLSSRYCSKLWDRAIKKTGIRLYFPVGMTKSTSICYIISDS